MQIWKNLNDYCAQQVKYDHLKENPDYGMDTLDKVQFPFHRINLLFFIMPFNFSGISLQSQFVLCSKCHSIRWFMVAFSGILFASCHSLLAFVWQLYQVSKNYRFVMMCLSRKVYQLFKKPLPFPQIITLRLVAKHLFKFNLKNLNFSLSFRFFPVSSSAIENLCPIKAGFDCAQPDICSIFEI